MINNIWPSASHQKRWAFPNWSGIACVPLIGLWGIANLAIAQEQVDYYTVLDALNAYEVTLNSLCLSGQYQERHEAVNRGNYTREHIHQNSEFDYDLPKGRWRFDNRSSWVYSKYSNEPIAVRSVESFDGQQSYRLLYTYISEPTGAGFPPSRPYKLKISGAEGSPSGNLYLFQLAGLRQGYQDARSLLTLLQTEPCTWEEEDQVSGVNCYKITIRPRSRDILITLWLDPAHSFLPLRQERRGLDDTGEPKEKISSWIETTEFSEFPIPGGKKIWWPTRARMAPFGSDHWTFELLDLRFHKDLPVEKFRIDADTLPPGVLVSDQVERTNYYTGGDEGQALYEEWQRLYDVVEERLKEKLGVHPDSMPPSNQPVIDKQKQNAGEGHSIWLITNVLLLALLVCGWLYYRLRKATVGKHI